MVGLACHCCGRITASGRVNNAVGSSVGGVIILLLAEVITIVDWLLVLVEAVLCK